MFGVWTTKSGNYRFQIGLGKKRLVKPASPHFAKIKEVLGNFTEKVEGGGHWDVVTAVYILDPRYDDGTYEVVICRHCSEGEFSLAVCATEFWYKNSDSISILQKTLTDI